jgi:hypothetical protein
VVAAVVAVVVVVVVGGGGALKRRFPSLEHAQVGSGRPEWPYSWATT